MLQRRGQRRQTHAADADPLRHARARDVHARAGVDLGLPVQRQVVVVLGDDHLCQQARRRDALVDHLRGHRRGLDGLALSTANLYSASQGTSAATPLGGSLFGLQFSNPVDPEVAYGGNAADAGTRNDGMVGKRVGGVNVFGGGLALYNSNERVVGGVGVSGDTSCADHNIGWRVRNYLNLDYVVKGVSGDATRPDNIIFDKLNGDNKGSTDGFEQPTCLNTKGSDTLPVVR